MPSLPTTFYLPYCYCHHHYYLTYYRRFLSQDGAPPLFEKVRSSSSSSLTHLVTYPLTCFVKVWITDSVPATVAAVTSAVEGGLAATLPPFEVSRKSYVVGSE